jgi:pyridoxal phosphate enzyme (YggS family)
MMNNLEEFIRDNYDKVIEKMSRAAKSVGRSPEEIKLLVVSKSQPVQMVEAAYHIGIRNFGENYPIEAVEKILIMNHMDIDWHMIGHLQTRKIGFVLKYFYLFHSLDSVRLANKINVMSNEQVKRLSVLIECNVCGEESKFGWKVNSLPDLDVLIRDLNEVKEYANLRICGLMAIPSISDDPNSSRRNFRKLKEIQSLLQKYVSGVELHDLSIGTSFDFEVAIQEGATIIRVGQAIFGPRPIKLND